MATNVAGTNARLFPWQMKHYIQRGGPNDPTLQASGGPPVTTGGVLGFNSSITFPPIPGTQTPPNVPLPRVMSMPSPGSTHVTTTGIITNNTGGILVGTIPGGSWIDNIEIYCYTTPTFGGTTPFTAVGLFYANANAFQTQAIPQPATLWTLASITSPTTGNVYSTFTSPANGVTTAGAQRAALTAYQVGPGNGVAGPQQLASLGPPEGQGFGGLTQGAAALASGDIDLYFVAFTVNGTSSANATMTAGEFAVRIDFTGQEG
jgi:hypothetical protein